MPYTLMLCGVLAECVSGCRRLTMPADPSTVLGNAVPTNAAPQIHNALYISKGNTLMPHSHLDKAVFFPSTSSLL